MARPRRGDRDGPRRRRLVDARRSTAASSTGPPTDAPRAVAGRALPLLPRDLRAQGVARAHHAERDGVSERATLTAKVVRPSVIDLKLLRPNGTVAWRYRRGSLPGTDPQGRRLPRHERTVVWRWVVEATENESGPRQHDDPQLQREPHARPPSSLESESAGRARARTAGVFISAVLARQARVGVVVLLAAARCAASSTRAIAAGASTSGAGTGGRAAGVLVPPEASTSIRVRATNAFGTVTLRDTVRVIRAR